jgi:hypothetical protein
MSTVSEVPPVKSFEVAAGVGALTVKLLNVQAVKKVKPRAGIGASNNVAPTAPAIVAERPLKTPRILDITVIGLDLSK